MPLTDANEYSQKSTLFSVIKEKKKKSENACCLCRNNPYN